MMVYFVEISRENNLYIWRIMGFGVEKMEGIL